MKTLFQVQKFLANYTPNSNITGELIISYLTQHYHTPPKTPFKRSTINANALDVELFTRWIERGLEALKIARFENNIVLLGNCTLETCEIIAILNETGKFSTDFCVVASDKILLASPYDYYRLQTALTDNNLQPDLNQLRLVSKYIPKNEEHVIFYDFALDVQGIGIVNKIAENGDVIFYCYCSTQASTKLKKVGYTLNENPGYNIRSFIFESIDKNNITTTLGNSSSLNRRLNNELGNYGKIWRDRTHRVEPTHMKVATGNRYYYITEDLKVCKGTEGESEISYFHYLAGNYFKDQKMAFLVSNKLRQVLKEYLSSEKWPNVE